MEFQIDTPKGFFEEHLVIHDNKRIIFSGAFGTGKTYFLDKFFTDNEEYEAIHLFPVNYSVASNEDIFELIKFDIIFKLLEKGVELDDVQIPKGVFLPYFFNNHQFDILAHILGYIPKLGGFLEKGAEKLINLKKKFDQEYENLNQSQEKITRKYLERFTTEAGKLYEEDYFSQLICQLVNQLQGESKEIHGNKKIVLIIDDLDRIDPEHIFRILNILAAHVDVRKDQNKFDFDQIILVCDIENIRRIFSNRYGMEVDFSGYIDKFYSKSIFRYTLSAEIIKKFLDVVESAPDLNNNQNASKNIIFILYSFIQNDLLPVRILLRNLDLRMKPHRRELWKDNKFGKPVTSKEIGLVNTIWYLINYFQDYVALIENCKKLVGKKLEYPFNISRETLFSELIVAFSYRSFFSNTEEVIDESGDISVQMSNFIFVYTIKRKISSNVLNDTYSFNIQYVRLAGDPGNPSINLDEIDYFNLLTWVLEKSEFGSLIKS